MKVEFQAEGVEAGTSAWGIVTISLFAKENYLTIQQPLDKVHGKNVPPTPESYHIERDDQSYGEYGGVAHVELAPEWLEVTLDERGRQHLQCDSVRANFSTDPDIYAALKEELRYIFGDKLLVNE